MDITKDSEKILRNQKFFEENEKFLTKGAGYIFKEEEELKIFLKDYLLYFERSDTLMEVGVRERILGDCRNGYAVVHNKDGALLSRRPQKSLNECIVFSSNKYMVELI